MAMSIYKRISSRIGKAALFLIISISSSYAQSTNVFYVQFDSKEIVGQAEDHLSPKAIERRAKYGIKPTATDFPVNSTYVAAVLGDTNIIFRYSLKWHNAIVVSSDENNLSKLEKLPFVKQVKYAGKATKILVIEAPTFVSPILKLKESDMTIITLTEAEYGASYGQNNQIGVIELHRKGFDGSGIDIAIFDAGFKNLNIIPAFVKHQGNGLLTYGYDLVDLDNELTNSDNHGTSCASCFGSYDKGKYIGSAPKAHVTLFRTENGSNEYPVEELNWCKAAEIADSLGVDMITSSLGYNKYDDTTLSYTHKDLNGKTSYISLAAKTATEKGILVINSAGNEGDNKWRKIGTPADAAEVLAVGAVSLKNKPGKFSSQGYNADGIVKPDIAACGVLAWVASPSGSYYQGYGTSYATPIAAGGVACLLQAYPELNPQQIRDLIKATALNAESPDSIRGYGVAQFDLAYELGQVQKLSISSAKILNIDSNQVIIFNPNNAKISYSVYYSKKLLGLFNIKKKLNSGKKDANSIVSRIKFDNSKLDCTQKYTIQVTLKSNVGNEVLKVNDLSLCFH
jgi:serine protease AprX